MRLVKRLSLVSFALTAAGCNVFYDQAAVSGVTETTFDERLPEALEEVFATCAEPLVIRDGTDEIDFAGDCELADLGTAGAQTVLLGLGINGPVELDEPVDGDLFRDTFTLAGFPWPMQNCEIDFTADLDLTRISLLDLDARWTTHDGNPAFYIDFDFASPVRVATANITGNVRCPSAINDAALQGIVNGLLPDGGRAVTVTGLDLDIWSELTHDGEDIEGALELDLDIASVNIDTWLTDLAAELGFDVLDLMALFGFERTMVEDQIEDILRPALAGLPDQVAALVQGEVPDGHRICSLAIVDGDHLRVTSDAPGLLSCTKLVVRQF